MNFNTSFRCFFEEGDTPRFTTHYVPGFAVSDIPRWIDSYKFTHPECVSISVKVWFASAVNESED